jgi:hypothetical protein
MPIPSINFRDLISSCDHVLTALIPLRPEAGERKSVLHRGNAQAQMAQQCRAVCPENRLDSPDLTPSDFFLFVYVMHCLHGMAFSSHRELRAAIEQVVSELRHEKFCGSEGIRPS